MYSTEWSEPPPLPAVCVLLITRHWALLYSSSQQSDFSVQPPLMRLIWLTAIWLAPVKFCTRSLISNPDPSPKSRPIALDVASCPSRMKSRICEHACVGSARPNCAPYMVVRWHEIPVQFPTTDTTVAAPQPSRF